MTDGRCRLISTKKITKSDQLNQKVKMQTGAVILKVLTSEFKVNYKAVGDKAQAYAQLHCLHHRIYSLVEECVCVGGGGGAD